MCCYVSQLVCGVITTQRNKRHTEYDEKLFDAANQHLTVYYKVLNSGKAMSREMHQLYVKEFRN